MTRFRKQINSNAETLIPINECERDLKEMTDLVPRLCELHEQEVTSVHAYCADCKTVACVICLIKKRMNHDCSHVSKFVDGFRKQIHSNVEVINECRSQAETKKAKLII